MGTAVRAHERMWVCVCECVCVCSTSMQCTCTTVCSSGVRITALRWVGNKTDTLHIDTLLCAVKTAAVRGDEK